MKLNMIIICYRYVLAVMSHLNSFGKKTWRSGTLRMPFECLMEGLVVYVAVKVHLSFVSYSCIIFSVTKMLKRYAYFQTLSVYFVCPIMM